MVVLTIFVRRARIGKAMRATSVDREAASMMGINTDRVIAITFFIGSALAGAAGVMFGLIYGQIFNLMGFLAGLKGFTAAVLGGIGSIPGQWSAASRSACSRRTPRATCRRGRPSTISTCSSC